MHTYYSRHTYTYNQVTYKCIYEATIIRKSRLLHGCGIYIPGGIVSRRVYPVAQHPEHLHACGHKASADLVGIPHTSVFLLNA